MKALITGILIYLTISEVYAKGNYLPAKFQPYMGFTYLIGYSETVLFQTGITYSPTNSALFMNAENSFSYTSRKHQWPGLGNYKMTQLINYSAVGIGIRTMRSYRLNICYTLKSYQYLFKGGIKTDNQEIKDKSKPDYFYRNASLTFSAMAIYKLNTNFSVYTSLSTFRYIQAVKGMMLSYGITYNIYGKNPGI